MEFELQNFLILLINFFLFTSNTQADETLVFAANEKLAEQKIAQNILTTIFEDSGIKILVKPMPPSRANAENLSKRVTGEIARIHKYGEKNPTLTRIEPSYYYLESAAFCLKSLNITNITMNDLHKYNIASIRGVAHSDELLRDHKRVQYVTSASQMFELLLVNRVDIIIDTKINGLNILKNDKYANRITLCGVVGKQNLYVYLNSSSSNLKETISNLFKKYIQSKKLENLIEQQEKVYY